MQASKPTLKDRLERVRDCLPKALQHPAVLQALQSSLAEDLDQDADFNRIWQAPEVGDVTSQATLPPNSQLEGQISAKAAGIIAGLPLGEAICQLVDPDIKFEPSRQEASRVKPGDLFAIVSGPGRALLAVERSMLNFIGRASGIASLTNRYVEAVAGTGAVVLDTRKTVPGLRHLDKYAVRMGGGRNHRAGLYDMVMIKDNHIDGAGGIIQAVQRVRKRYEDTYKIEVEVKNLTEMKTALGLNIDRIMLDNMDLREMRQAVNLNAGKVELEASGNVTLDTIRAIAETGVDFISSGALTHSVPVLDISMRLRYH